MRPLEVIGSDLRAGCVGGTGEPPQVDGWARYRPGRSARCHHRPACIAHPVYIIAGVAFVCGPQAGLTDTDTAASSWTPGQLSYPLGHGTVTVNADGLFDCSPDVSFVGGDSFKQNDDFVTWVAAESRRSISVPDGSRTLLASWSSKRARQLGASRDLLDRRDTLNGGTYDSRPTRACDAADP